MLEAVIVEQKSPAKSERNGASEALQATVVPKINIAAM
jgi:hypothetical protein